MTASRPHRQRAWRAVPTKWRPTVKYDALKKAGPPRKGQVKQHGREEHEPEEVRGRKKGRPAFPFGKLVGQRGDDPAREEGGGRSGGGRGPSRVPGKRVHPSLAQEGAGVEQGRLSPAGPVRHRDRTRRPGTGQTISRFNSSFSSCTVRAHGMPGGDIR